MEVKQTNCRYHFTISVNQIIMLYNLNFHSDIYQLFLNKTGPGKIFNVNFLKDGGSHTLSEIMYLLVS